MGLFVWLRIFRLTHSKMWVGLSAATTVTHHFFRVTFIDGLRFANPASVHAEFVILDVRNEQIGYLLPHVRFFCCVKYLGIQLQSNQSSLGFFSRGCTPTPASRLTIHGGTSYILLGLGCCRV